MSTAEILAQLPRLSPEERDQVRAKLDELAGAARTGQGASVASDDPGAPVHRSAHLRSPRLADPARSGDFKKRIVELLPDA